MNKKKFQPLKFLNFLQNVYFESYLFWKRLEIFSMQDIKIIHWFLSFVYKKAADDEFCCSH